MSLQTLMCFWTVISYNSSNFFPSIDIKDQSILLRYTLSIQKKKKKNLSTLLENPFSCKNNEQELRDETPFSVKSALHTKYRVKNKPNQPTNQKTRTKKKQKKTHTQGNLDILWTCNESSFSVIILKKKIKIYWKQKLKMDLSNCEWYSWSYS